MKQLFLAAVLMSTACLTPVHAGYLFGGSGDYFQTLTINGNLTFTTAESPFTSGVKNQGWYSETMGHMVGNDNYYVTDDAEDRYRNFFTFNLSEFNGVAASAVLSIVRTGNSGNGLPLNYSLWDVTTAASTLNLTDGINASIFHDLGSGTLYGSAGVTQNLAGPLEITLTASALADITASGGGFFSIGGTLSPDVAETPEPATFGVIGIALFAGAAVRRRWYS